MKAKNPPLLDEKPQPGAVGQAPDLNVVTGAFGYTGRYITRRLLSEGKKVLTLTGHPNRENPFGDRVAVAPFSFNNPDKLAKRMQGATTLFNTYWVRFSYGQMSHDVAVENTMTLIEAAAEAGVRKIVHVSVANASPDSPLPYFRGKGLLERVIADSRLSYAIVRPTVIFGTEDVLINNIAWLLRRFPVFAIPGSGDYRLQPVFAADVAEIAVRAAQMEQNVTIDAAGPEVYTFDELVRLIARTIRSRAMILRCRPKLALFASKLVGKMVGDVVLTDGEVAGLMANLLVSNDPPTGQTRFSDWLNEHHNSLGTAYASELERHFAHGG